MERLTPAEEKVMFPNPKPAYNTVSTIVRILERKKFIKHKPMGRGYIYLPKIGREQYRDYLADYILKFYFDGSRNEIVSFYNSNVSLNEIL